MSKTQIGTTIEVSFYCLLLSKRGVSSPASSFAHITVIIARKEPDTGHTKKMKR